MIWIRPDKEGKPVKWYSDDLIEVIKACCLEREFLSSKVIMQIIKDYENV